MWLKTRFAQWEVEGQVRERVNDALAEGEQARLARTVKGITGRKAPRRTLYALWAGLARFPLWARAGLMALHGHPRGGQEQI
jgi:hypothetical protein